MGGVGIDTKTSPRGAAIKKIQYELRQEYDVLEERIKQLEFLQKGGDPLDFKFGHTVSVSVQSTSLTDQQVDQFVASETKGSFPFTASTQGDSVQSSGRPGSSQLCEPNTADNLNLFDGENKFIESERTFRCVSRNNIALQAKSTHMAGNHNVKELGDSVALGVPRKAYKRRYRTRPSRDGAKSNSNDVHTCGGPSYSVTNDSKGLIFDLEKQWSRNITGQTTCSNGVVTSKTVLSNDHGMVELDTMEVAEPVNEMEKVCQPNYVSDIVFSTDIINNPIDQRSVGVSQESPTEVALEGSELLSVKEKGGFGGLETQLAHREKVDGRASSRKMYGSSNAKSGMKTISNDRKHIRAASASKVLDSASSCTQASLSLNGKKDSEFCIDHRNIDSTVHMKDQTPIAERNCVLERNVVKHVKEIKADGICGFVSEECSSVQRNHKESGFGPELVEHLVRNESTLQSEIKDEVVSCKESISSAVLKTEVIPSLFVSVNSNIQDNNVCSDLPGSFDSSVPYHTKDAEAIGISSAFYVGPQSEIKTKLVTRADEDSILEEARIIEAKRKRIIELSSVNTMIESRCKSHWDFVLEEMPWLANDFVQERLWKISAASRVSYHAATTSQLWFQEINDSWKHKKLSHTLAKAVMDFWQSMKGMNKKAELQSPKNDGGHTIKEYAAKFLKCNNFDVPDSLNEAPVTPEIEDNLFYTVSPGAAEIYRKAIESQVLEYEKNHTKMQEGLETSACETIADYAYEEDERELTMHDMPVAFCRSNSSRFSKKRKLHMHTYSRRSYAIVADLSFTEGKENKLGSQQSKPHPKRPTTSLNVSFPRKRIRTCYRSSVLSPFNDGTSSLQMSPKTDASSETSSFQDNQSILPGGSLVPNSVEVESVGNFEKHLKFDSAEVSTKPKKKKAKYPGSSYEQRWLDDSNFQIVQFHGDYSRKRLERHQFESNGCNGINHIINQRIPKKPKKMRPSLETSSEYNSPIPGSAPSHSASQFSNMPNTNKFTRMLTGRDLSKKAKSLKMPAGLAGSGSQWSPFEDQALVVLVHDMGPNWELVSDAINSTLEFKCIYRTPMECKEHHKILMVTNVDGADSTQECQETRSSQPYPSTLPGIPKGSARQLFQRLLGPVEEATRKSHFEKIILIGQKYLFGKTQGKQDRKQLQQPHSSHTNALSQVVPNNLNGIILTPLDLCDAPSSSLDILSHGFQIPHSSGLAVSNQGGLAPMSPSGAISATVQGSLSVIHGNDFSSPSSPLNATVRSTSMPVDEQKRMHHSNQLLLGSSTSISSGPGALQGPDRDGVCVLPGGNGMGMIYGMNGGMPTARHGFQGIASPSMPTPGSMTFSMVAMSNTVNMHPGVGSVQGNSMSISHDNLHMIGPIQNQETSRQMMIADLQVQDISQDVPPPFGGLITSCPNQTSSLPIPSYLPHRHHPSQLSHVLSSPLHSQASGAANHASNTQQPSYASNLTKEKQMHQRHVQLKQKFNTSNSLTQSVQQHQLPLSPPFHSNPQITSQSPPHASLSPLSSTSSVASMPQHPSKHSMSRHGHFRSAQRGPTTNKLSKQQQQTSRKDPQQRQQNIEVSKGEGRGNALNQDMQMYPSALNQTSLNSITSIATEKGYQLTNSVENSVCPAKSSSTIDVGQAQQTMHPGKAATKPLKPRCSANKSKCHSMITKLESSPPAGYHNIAMPVIRSSNHQPIPHSQYEVHTQKKLLNESYTNESQFNQHAVSNSTPIGTVKATASECNIANNATSPNVSQLKAAEPLFDSAGSLRTTAAVCEDSSLGIQVLNQRQSSGCLSPLGHDASLQWEHHQQQQ